MTTRRRFLAGAGAAAAAASVGSGAAASEFGVFSGEAILRFIGAQRGVVERDLTFRDPQGVAWTTPAGVEVNGASIPRALWTIVGAPFSGEYLRASVIHDHYCVTMERDWRATHLVFYHGCRADGLSELYASLLYAGVMRFGPRWVLRSPLGGRTLSGAANTRTRLDPEFDPEAFEDLKAWVEKNRPSVEEINRRVL